MPRLKTGAFHQFPGEVRRGLRNRGEDLGEPVLTIQDIALRSLD
jgi:hypothetical protein